MSIINETFRNVLDNTISCSVTPDELIIRTLALIGLISIGSSVLKGIGLGLGYPIAYIIGFFKWIYTILKRRN